MGYILEAVNLKKRFGNVIALDGVSLALARGETKVVMGPNGAGKSTLLRCLNLLVRPDEGKVLFDGIDLTALGTDVYRVRRRIGFVPQDAGLFSHMTVLDNVLIGPLKVKKMPREEAFRVAVRALERVGIDRDLWKRYPAQLSGGQRQRVAIARALAMEPEVMLYDEPTSNLDPVAAAEVAEIIISLSRSGVTSLVVTHDIGLAMAVASEVILLNRRVVYRGSISKLLDGEILEAISDPEVRKFVKALTSRLYAKPRGDQRYEF